MPYDAMNCEEPPDSGVDFFPRISQTTRMKEDSGILSAMREAGRALVALAKRAGIRGLLSAMIATGAVLCVPQAADAATVTVTINGTVSTGTVFGTAPVFGYAPGTDLTGKPYTVVFTFDDTLGTELPPVTSGGLIVHSGVNSTSSSSSPATDTTLQIGGSAPYDFGASYTSGATLGTGYFPHEAFYNAYSSNTNGQIAADLTVEVISSSGDFYWPIDGDWTASFTDNTVPTPSGTTGGSFQVYNSTTGINASGEIAVSSIMVSGAEASDPLAKTLGSCGCPDSQSTVDPFMGGGSQPDIVGQASVAYPVTVGTGNMFEQVTDYATAGQNQLNFTRYYNSLGSNIYSETFATTLGVNWRGSYDSYLHISPATGQATSVVAERADGQVISFTFNGSAWTTDSDVDSTLTQSGSAWTLTNRNDTVFSYTANSTGEGRLNSITLRNGYSQTLSYSGGLLSTVTDSYGRSLNFTYAGGLLETVTTPDSLILTYGFTAATGGNQLTSVSYNTNPVTSQTYLYENMTLPFALTGIEDENSNRFATWAYDGSGYGISSQHGTGAATADLTTLTYNSNNTTPVTNAFGVEDTYTFTTLQGVPKVTEISRAATSTTAAATRTFSYDTNGYLNSATDWNGNETTYVNNSHGLPTTIKEAVGTSATRTTTISYDPTFVHLPHQIITPGLTSTFVYDGSGNPLTRTDLDTTVDTLTGRGPGTTAPGRTEPYSTTGQKRVTRWEWSSTGEETSVQLPRTDVTAKTSFAYDGSGALTQITDALNHATKITSHTGGGLPLTVVDPNSVTTTLAYDGRLNLHTSTLSTTAGKLITTYIHDPANNLTSVQLPDNSTFTYGYDTAHRLSNITDLFGNSINYTLDALGDKTLVQVENASKTVTRKHSGKCDALGRVLNDIGGMGQTTTYTYDNNGNALTISPPLPSGTVTYTYDALNRRSTAKDPSPGGTTRVSYDAHDRVLSVIDANGHTTSYVYDGFGDRTQTASPDSGKTVYRYDPDRNMTQVVKPSPLTANMTYDALDRPLTTTYPNDSTLTVVRTYDQATGHGFGVGRLTSATDQVGSLSLTYDERGNITQESRVVTSTATPATSHGFGALTSPTDDAGSWNLVYTRRGIAKQGSLVATEVGTLNTVTTFDAASRVSGITYPSGTLVAYGRDSMGRVTSVTAHPPGAASPSNVATGITYEPFGPETGLAFGNGINGAYGYDLDYRPTTRVDTGTTAVQNLTYGYLTNDSVQTITDALNTANTQTFGYDTLDRLTSATSGTGGYGTFGFTWDPVSNIETQVVNGTTTTYSLATGSNKLSQLVTGTTTETVASTAAGNISALNAGSSTLDTFTYNQANEMASAQSSSSAATYEYDFGGQRLEKAVAASYPILYQYSRTGGQLLSENDLHEGQAADYIYLNGRPIGEVNPTNGKLYFTHTDRLGTPQRLTDSTKAVAWNATYLPFGNTMPFSVSGTLTTQSLRLPGQQFDSETGYNHNGFRDYAPGLTRYVESDPIGLAGGMNTYQYAGGNPYKWADRSGLCIGPLVWALPYCVGVIADVGTAAWELWQGYYTYQAVTGFLDHPNIVANEAARPDDASQKPEDCPTGTKPVDKDKRLDRQSIHSIKDQLGAGPNDWVGITPGGHIVTNEGGNAVDNGPYEDYLP